MRLAKAMKFGGQLIDAADCDYNSYKELGLLCPVCGNLVYLAKGQTKTSKLGKTFEVPPHFKHFKEHALIADRCELRVKQYSEKEIKQAENIARNQRLKFFKTWFWSLVDKVPLTGEGEPIKEILSLHDILYAEAGAYSKKMDEIYNTLKPCFKFLKTSMLHDFFEDLRSGHPDIIADSKDGKNQAIFLLKDLKAKVDLKLHEQICSEAIDYALTKKNRYHLTRLFFNSIVACNVTEQELLESFTLTPERSAVYCFSSIVTICLVPWAQEFNLKVNKVGQATR